MRFTDLSSPVRLCLERSQVVGFVEPARALTLRCESGVLWVTVEGTAEDLVLRAGESGAFPAGRLIVVQALQSAVVRVSDPAQRAAA